MDVSIIIVNYNTKEITNQCINSIFNHTFGLDFEVIVVDNFSTDGSAELFSKDNRIKYIYSQKNLGFGKANNLGYKYSSGKFIFLLNPDTLLLNNAVYYFYTEMSRFDKNVACIGSVLKAQDGMTDTHSYGKFPTNHTLLQNLFNLYFKRKVEHEYFEYFPLEVDYITGADLFIRRKVIDKLGFFDEDFFMYFEETDLQYRYRKAGYKSLVIDKPKIVHLEGITTKNNSPQYSWRHWILYFNGYKTYAKKHTSKIDYFIFRILILFYIPALISRHYSVFENMSIIRNFFVK